MLAHGCERQQRAHPRVGGENGVWGPLTTSALGSSPRGRGKPTVAARPISCVGLIPAWAGKTRRPPGCGRTREAHPRVGGENSKENPAPPKAAWLIPAWAGKT